MYKNYLVLSVLNIPSDVDLHCELNFIAAECAYYDNFEISHYFFNLDKKRELNTILRNYGIIE